MALPVNIVDPLDEIVAIDPVRVGPGRGDLRHHSMPAAQWFGLMGAGRGSLELVGGKLVSHARLVAEQPWVAAAVMRLLTWAVRVPLKAYRRTGDDSRERLRPDVQRPHAVAKAVVDPWEGASQAQLIQALLGPMLVHGNSVVGVQEGASGAVRFDDFDWRTLTPILASHRRIAGWQVSEDGDQYEVSADDSIHVAWWSPLSVLGISPLRQLGTTVRIEDAAQRYQQSLFRNGARPPSAISVDKDFLGLAEGERGELMANLRADVHAIYGSPEQAGLPAILPPGLTWDQVGHTAVEAELIDQRRVAREEVAAVYQIPPPMLGILDRATYSNIQTQREMSYTDALGPPLVLIEQALNAQLVRQLRREDDIYVEFDFAGVLRGDRLKEVQALREAIHTGLLTPNEGRAKLNEPRSDEPLADELWMPQNNLAPIGAPPPRRGAPKPQEAAP